MEESSKGAEEEGGGREEKGKKWRMGRRPKQTHLEKTGSLSSVSLLELRHCCSGGGVGEGGRAGLQRAGEKRKEKIERG